MNNNTISLTEAFERFSYSFLYHEQIIEMIDQNFSKSNNSTIYFQRTKNNKGYLIISHKLYLIYKKIEQPIYLLIYFYEDFPESVPEIFFKVLKNNLVLNNKYVSANYIDANNYRIKIENMLFKWNKDISSVGHILTNIKFYFEDDFPIGQSHKEVIINDTSKCKLNQSSLLTINIKEGEIQKIKEQIKIKKLSHSHDINKKFPGMALGNDIIGKKKIAQSLDIKAEQLKQEKEQIKKELENFMRKELVNKSEFYLKSDLSIINKDKKALINECISLDKKLGYLNYIDNQANNKFKPLNKIYTEYENVENSLKEELINLENMINNSGKLENLDSIISIDFENYNNLVYYSKLKTCLEYENEIRKLFRQRLIDTDEFIRICKANSLEIFKFRCKLNNFETI